MFVFISVDITYTFRSHFGYSFIDWVDKCFSSSSIWCDRRRELANRRSFQIMRGQKPCQIRIANIYLLFWLRLLNDAFKDWTRQVQWFQINIFYFTVQTNQIWVFYFVFWFFRLKLCNFRKFGYCLCHSLFRCESCRFRREVFQSFRDDAFWIIDLFCCESLIRYGKYQFLFLFCFQLVEYHFCLVYSLFCF